MGPTKKQENGDLRRLPQVADETVEKPRRLPPVEEGAGENRAKLPEDPSLDKPRRLPIVTSPAALTMPDGKKVVVELPDLLKDRSDPVLPSPSPKPGRPSGTAEAQAPHRQSPQTEEAPAFPPQAAAQKYYSKFGAQVGPMLEKANAFLALAGNETFTEDMKQLDAALKAKDNAAAGKIVDKYTPLTHELCRLRPLDATAAAQRPEESPGRLPFEGSSFTAFVKAIDKYQKAYAADASPQKNSPETTAAAGEFLLALNDLKQKMGSSPAQGTTKAAIGAALLKALYQSDSIKPDAS